MNKKVLFFACLILILSGFTSDQKNTFLPEFGDQKIILHQYYSLSFNETYLQANWVAYQISDSTAFGSYSRGNNFKEDPELPNLHLKSYYEKSGYDRGHLCPAGSMAFNPIAMSESFYMSNMSPQLPGFNRGIWKTLETQVRTWGYENKSIFVVTGPVLTTFIDTIGNIPVPKYYFKVILDYQEPEIKAIGFLLENQSSSSPLIDYAVSIDSVEYLTGIDFFHELPDSIENILEGIFNTELWSWKPIKVSINKSENITNQCIAITSFGDQCSRLVSINHYYCWQHQVETGQVVWVCEGSKIYHTDQSHRGLRKCKTNPTQMKLTEAIVLGLRQCKD